MISEERVAKVVWSSLNSKDCDVSSLLCELMVSLCDHLRLAIATIISAFVGVEVVQPF